MASSLSWLLPSPWAAISASRLAPWVGWMWTCRWAMSASSAARRQVGAHHRAHRWSRRIELGGAGSLPGNARVAHEATVVGIAPGGSQTRYTVCLSDSLRNRYFTVPRGTYRICAGE